MGKIKTSLEADKLLSNYIRMKVTNNLGNHVDALEFRDFTDWLIEYLNNDKFSSRMYNIDEENFDIICQNLLVNQVTSYGGEEFEYQDGVVEATYYLLGSRVYGGIEDTSVKNAVSAYIDKKVAEKEYEVSKFPVSSLDNEQEQFTKKIAGYLVHDLMDRYIRHQIENNHWPIQCKDAYQYILEHDLASIIKLEGTREAFLNVYVNATRVIGELVAKGEPFQISNNSNHPLAFSHYMDVVGPYPFIRDYCYDKYEMFNKELNVKVAQGKIAASERQCVYNDMYDGDDEYAIHVPDVEATDYDKIEALTNGLPLMLEKVKAKRI